MTAAELRQSPSGRSFSGSLAAFGGLLTAVAGLLTVLWQIGVLGASGGSAAPAVPPAPERTAQIVKTSPAASVYAGQLAALLRNSADTRGDLGTLITGVQNRSIGFTEAKARIAAVISQRQSLRDDVARLETPPAFARSAELLRRSLTAALEDDVAVQRWIVAHFEGDPAAEGPAWNDQIAASSRATAAKRAFLDAYATVAGRVGHLPAVPVAF